MRKSYSNIWSKLSVSWGSVRRCWLMFGLWCANTLSSFNFVSVPWADVIKGITTACAINRVGLTYVRFTLLYTSWWQQFYNCPHRYTSLSAESEIYTDYWSSRPAYRCLLTTKFHSRWHSIKLLYSIINIGSLFIVATYHVVFTILCPYFLRTSPSLLSWSSVFS